MGSGTPEEHKILFETVRVGPLTMRNRFYKVPHCTSFGAERPGAQAGIRAIAAEGGWAVVNTESCSVHPSSDEAPWISGRMWDEDDVSNWAQMVDAVHEHGSLVGIELDHAGGHMPNYESRQVNAGVSQMQDDAPYFSTCFELDRTGIREIQGFYVQAAQRARRAGFDIINVYGGHGHSLPQQFLDPFYNRRTDEYGGSFENRARFWLELIEQVRTGVDEHCAIVARICLDSLRDGGLHIDETTQFIESADHLVDLWDLQLGGVPDEWGEDSLPSRFGAQSYQTRFIEQIRPHTKKPSYAGILCLTP